MPGIFFVGGGVGVTPGIFSGGFTPGICFLGVTPGIFWGVLHQDFFFGGGGYSRNISG
jgi:hypothetical protein